MDTKSRVPAVEGWFTIDGERPALLGTRCTACSSWFFPAERFACRNPDCTSRDLEDAELSTTGTIWSFTNNCFQPPPPYVPRPTASGEFEPFAIAAVELAREQIVILGQVADGVPFESLRAGTPVELVVETLYEDDDHEYLIWRWRPTTATAVDGTQGSER